MTTWGQIGIAIMELARLKARRRLRAVRRNLLARLVKFRSWASRNCCPPAWHYETANSERQRGGVLPRIRSNPCLIDANLASM
jgi:hypothetical protein